MRAADLEESLLAELESMRVIDCHEHLSPESHRVPYEQLDVFILFSFYVTPTLKLAGMTDEQLKALYDQSVPVERRWQIADPFWRRIRHTSFARAIRLGIGRLYGFDDLNADTAPAVSDAMRRANTPGLYRRVLCDLCRIETCITQNSSTNMEGADYLVPVMPMLADLRTREAVTRPPFAPGRTVDSLDDYLDAVAAYAARVKSEGAVGLKTSAHPGAAPDRAAAREAFEALRSGAVESLPAFNPLRDFVEDHAIAAATSLDLVVCVHTGYWGDFRELAPSHLIPTLQRHPGARFDVYHVGYPYVREALMLGKGFSNVWLNFTWTHIISQLCGREAFDEAIDLLPANKVFAFGGDHGAIEKVVGHLRMARENLAAVLARRILAGRLDRSDALQLAHAWFYENPKAVYRL